ncbi:hypothetical protein KKG83_07680 [Candidatus Micrarchaeota archaeon]|nr:hypothetical protein [Candidatus Micrarchaeota archaeon]MBU2477321.1 hypothetical protein [Candidatus Micrarchaeota archaeon]
MILILGIAFITGILTKLTDLIEEHGVKLPKYVVWVSGAGYGILIALIIAFSPELSTLWLATVAGVLIAGKIDSTGHYLGLGVTILFVLFLGIASVNYYFLALFIVVAVSEELINTQIVDKGKIKHKFLSDVMGLRPILELTAFLIALYSGIWLVWFGLLSYDLGYILMAETGKSFFLKVKAD